ncbi:glycoside hydrolase family 72 protein [Dothidotthia symphoricarpi CBS 119687]|uniref:1,3-beta-glucanosyltransferase n=1 Tax=Dothidotthia symphoricarpi CBS 119687 TaxID=1392245 RepID=A0A6A6AE47_9PLEO|nr:glycoside hydrolase family 72 protein [Dothidotthia symphoricarpi CBS 119687]KAF2129248.1 glycoside hydrolase family 72 protein [Dothidotthia symphoricarpi CBS 119687]
MPSLFRSFALASALFSAANAVNPVEVRGQEFVDTVTNQRLMIIGADYQPGGQGAYKPQSGEDALTNADVCLRDAAVMQRLGVNTIRVYNVSPTLNHSECVSIFNAAGIYLLIDVNSPLPGESIDRSAPWTTYNSNYLQRAFGIIENFKNFPNTLGFFAANEVMNDLATAEYNPQYIRAVQRDLKNYIKNHADRTIPVGYSAADVREILQDTWAYMQCAHDDDMSSSDFFGLNSYSWCGEATFQTSGYDGLVSMFNETAIPIFFSEYGCNEVKPRVFTEVEALYSDQMKVLSGGLVYEYSFESADYGLVTINSNGSVSLLQDYDNLQERFNNIDLSAQTATNSASVSITAPQCAASLITAQQFSTNFTIPAVCPGCQTLITNGISSPSNGALVSVTQRTVSQEVYGSSGGKIQNLELSVLSNNGVNSPGGETTSPSATGSSAASPSGTGSAAQPTASTTGAANSLSSSMWLWMALLTVMILQ